MTEGVKSIFTEKQLKIYEKGAPVLHSPYHDRLLADIDRFAAMAGIAGSMEYIWQSVHESKLGVKEKEYLKSFPLLANEGKFGLAYLGDVKNIPDRMMSIVGILLRNYVDARFISMSDIFSLKSKGEEVQGSCLCIPNFYIRKESGLSVHEWKVQAVYDLLIQRLSAGKQTVVQIEDTAAFTSAYGTSVWDLIKTKYEGVAK